MTAKNVSQSGPDASSTAGVCGAWVVAYLSRLNLLMSLSSRDTLDRDAFCHLGKE